MKFYILKHPTKGYITNKGKRPNFTENVEINPEYYGKIEISNTINRIK